MHALQVFSSSLSSFFIGINVAHLFPLTLCLIIGITCYGINFSPLSLLLGIGASTIIFQITTGLSKRALILFGISILCLYGGWWRCTRLAHRHKQLRQKIAAAPVTLRATVQAIEKSTPGYKVWLALHHIEGISCSYDCIITFAQKPSFDMGDIIEISSVPIRENSSQDFTHYLLKENLIAYVFVNHNNYSMLYRPSWSLSRFLFHQKQTLLFSLKKKLKLRSFQLFSSLFLGNRSIIPKEKDPYKDLFKTWGISHYLARSGLHLIIFILLWHFLVNLLPVGFLYKQGILLMLTITYALLSWSSISFERALFMFIVYKGCTIAYWPLHYIHLITLVTFCVLLYNPFQLFFLDFQLSFGITFALAWFASIQTSKQRLLA